MCLVSWLISQWKRACRSPLHSGGHALRRGVSGRPHFSPAGEILDTAHLYSVLDGGTEPQVGNSSFGFTAQLCLLG